MVETEEKDGFLFLFKLLAVTVFFPAGCLRPLFRAAVNFDSSDRRYLPIVNGDRFGDCELVLGIFMYDMGYVVKVCS
jgi:hypothetical protein